MLPKPPMSTLAPSTVQYAEQRRHLDAALVLTAEWPLAIDFVMVLATNLLTIDISFSIEITDNSLYRSFGDSQPRRDLPGGDLFVFADHRQHSAVIGYERPALPADMPLPPFRSQRSRLIR